MLEHSSEHMYTHKIMTATIKVDFFLSTFPHFKIGAKA